MNYSGVEILKTHGKFYKTFLGCKFVGNDWTCLSAERDFLKLFTLLKESGVTPHVPLFFGETLEGDDLSFVMDDCGKSLLEVLEEISDDDLLGILFQVIYTIYAIQKIYPNFKHNDLHLGNVLVRKMKYSDVRCYKVGRKMFKIENCKFFATIIDFGRSSMQEIIENPCAFSHEGLGFGVSTGQSKCSDLTLFLLQLRTYREFFSKTLNLKLEIIFKFLEKVPDYAFDTQIQNGHKLVYPRFDHDYFTGKEILYSNAFKFFSIPVGSTKSFHSPKRIENRPAPTTKRICPNLPVVKFKNGVCFTCMKYNPVSRLKFLTKINKTKLELVTKSCEEKSYDHITEEFLEIKNGTINAETTRILNKIIYFTDVPNNLEIMLYQVTINAVTYKFCGEKTIAIYYDVQSMMMYVQLSKIVRLFLD